MENWNSLAEAYRASFATLCAGTIAPLLDAVSVGSVGHVSGLRTRGALLDVGCGTGDLLVAARERGLLALGIDGTAGMAAASRAVAPGCVARGALPRLPVRTASCAGVTANFVVNHVDDPRASMDELARVTGPGGVVAATIWPAGGAGWGPLVGGVLQDAGAVSPPSTRLPAHLDFDRSVEGLADLAGSAGLLVTDAREVTWTWRPTPAELWAGIAGGVATPGATYLAQDADTRVTVQRLFEERCIPAEGSDRMAFPCRAVLVVGIR